MFIKNPPTCPAGVILKSTSQAEQAVERALIESGLQFELAPQGLMIEATNGSVQAAFYLPTVNVAIEVRSDHEHAKLGDLVYVGEQGYRDLVTIFASFKCAQVALRAA